MNRIKAHAQNVAMAGLALALAGQAAFAEGNNPIKKISADASQELVIEFGNKSVPASPQILDLPGPSHRLIIDFAEANLDKGTLPSPEELTKVIGKAIPFVKAVKYQELANAPKPTARVIVDLPEEVAVKPRVVKLADGVAVVAFSDSPIAYTEGGAEEVAADATAGGEGSAGTLQGNGKMKLEDGSVVNVKMESVKRYNKAVQLHLSGKLTDAIAAYKDALAVNKQLAEAHSNLGLIFNQQHNYAQALAEFRKALAINPKDAITYNGIGAALRAEHDLQGAIKNWQTAVSLDSKLATAHYNLGTAYEIEKDYDKALNSYREAVKNDYRLGEAYYRMGLILEVRKHRNEEACEQFKESLKISSDSEYSEDARQRLLYIQGKKTKVSDKDAIH